MSKDVRVELGGRSYAVRIGAGLIERAGTLAADLLPKDRVAVVADVNAWAHHGQKLTVALAATGKTIVCYEVPAGESSKSWQSLENLTDWLLDQSVERGECVIALGGGVVGDLTGFACAILKRGCGFIQIPTTLLAQVDSSVGGKTAINTRTGKNLIGAFHQPSLVLVDIGTLASLPDREMRAGYAEVIKYGLLGDPAFFGWLGHNSKAVLTREPEALTHAIATSVEAKARIVAEDERETSGVRALLNLGHTFGHALEAETGFSKTLLHGEAVALGMVLAAQYSARRGELSVEAADEIAQAIADAGLPAQITDLELSCSGEVLVDHMRHDKKMEGGTLPFLLLRGIGDAYLARDIELADIAAFLEEQLKA